MPPLFLPDLFAVDYNWSLNDLRSLTPLQLCLTPFHPDYHEELFNQVQLAFFEKQNHFFDRQQNARRCFGPLMELLWQFQREGIPTPFRSVVASRLLASFGSWRALGGFRTWTEYAGAAENWGLVQLIPDDPTNSGSRIAAVEGVVAPLKFPLSWTEQDLPLNWRRDPSIDYLSPNQIMDLTTDHLVGLVMLCQNRGVANYARDEFFARWDEASGVYPEGVGQDGLLASNEGWAPEAPYSAPQPQLPWPTPFPQPQPFAFPSHSQPPQAHQHPQPPLLAPQIAVDPRKPNPPAAPPSAPAPPPAQSITPPRTPPRISTSSAPSQRLQAQPAPVILASSDPRPPKKVSSRSATSSSVLKRITKNKSPLPHHLIRQLRVVTVQYTSTDGDSSLSFLIPPLLPDAIVHRRSKGSQRVIPPLLPDAIVHRRSKGSQRVVELAYATLDRTMFAFGEISTAEMVEHVELGDVEWGEWAWKNVLGGSEWGREAWDKEKENGGVDESRRKREHEEERGSITVKRARAE
ncbi:hypothetical protein BCR35DRAFT_305285 [Leucosporidium creatinivorum]|uniref:Uncharacterized protein n=1 Tax=Leucosporidium creatinivorum TaxID=106004 RepID=A0A1Y2F591_9BASI|nr:hypothetical protein BCR35DRAFT_305285 [Leucosporidium creatinivorum]